LRTYDVKIIWRHQPNGKLGNAGEFYGHNPFVAFAVQDVLLLRILFVAGSIPALGFYYYLTPFLWSAIGWTCLYMAIHSYWIVRIYLERRPVVLALEEKKLYELAFSKLDPRKFLTLVSIGKWKNRETGEYLFQKGEEVLKVCIHISGKVRVIFSVICGLFGVS